MTDESNEPKLLTGNEEPLDDFSASMETKVVIENIHVNLRCTARLLSGGSPEYSPLMLAAGQLYRAVVWR